MKRLWYLDIRKRGDSFLLEAVNVFDGCEPDEPVSAEVPDSANVEAILRVIKPFTRISRRYMEINGLGTLLRIASLSKVPLDDLLAQALEDLPSGSPPVLITPFLTRDELLSRLRRRDVT
jgi:hypothetical protein